MLESFKKDTLHNLSSDHHKEQYMTDSVFKAIDFDYLVKNYIFSFGSPSIGLSSNDALISIDNEQNFVFIEFKNGNCNQNNIRKKMTESLWVLNDILGNKNLMYDRTHINYILVYNEGDSKNKGDYEYPENADMARHGAKKSGKKFRPGWAPPESICNIFFHSTEIVDKGEFEQIAKNFEAGTYKF